MKRMIILAAAVLVCAFSSAQDRLQPSGTYRFAEKDGTELFLDVYDPAPGSETSVDGRQKPTVMFVFGGGFMMGSRNQASYDRWFRLLTDNGYRVVANDYRLALKGVRKMGVGQVDLLRKAVEVAVEDLFSATSYLVENAGRLGIDPSNIVVSGSSAGAITALQAEWYISNSHEMSAMLPEGFNYAGVMSFAGAVYSDRGAVRFDNEPAPVLMFHGKEDKIVTYKQIWFFKHRFAGSSVLSRTFKKNDCNYRVYRFEDYGHEISGIMAREFSIVDDFLLHNVMEGRKLVVDADVVDRDIRHYRQISNLSDLYEKPVPQNLNQL